VRGHFGSFRECYEAGLARNRTIGGRVLVKFRIDPDGTVAQAEDIGSDLPDKVVVACVVDGYRTLRFPKPAGDGPVTVIYPISFSPAE
jgi:TonB family protein